MPPLQIVSIEASEVDYTPERIARIAERAKKYRDIPFVGDVLKQYRRKGTMSPKQAAVLWRIIADEEGL